MIIMLICVARNGMCAEGKRKSSNLRKCWRMQQGHHTTSHKTHRSYVAMMMYNGIGGLDNLEWGRCTNAWNGSCLEPQALHINSTAIHLIRSSNASVIGVVCTSPAWRQNLCAWCADWLKVLTGSFNRHKNRGTHSPSPMISLTCCHDDVQWHWWVE